MNRKLEELVNRREFHIVMIVTLIVIIVFIVGVLILRYTVQGETNLPFNLSKIVVISSTEGIDQEDAENRWNIKVNQNNDIYLYIEKNDSYNKTEIISSIILDNFEVTKNSEKGEEILYKPSESETTIFKNAEENKASKIEYIGDLETNVKECKISNQGGLVVFRYSLDNLGTYISNDEDQILHQELLKKIGITNEELQLKISFNINIKLESGKTYKATITQDLPIDNIVEEGTTKIEQTDLKNIIFKRVENN